jgi:hypothetical protein
MAATVDVELDIALVGDAEGNAGLLDFLSSAAAYADSLTGVEHGGGGGGGGDGGRGHPVPQRTSPGAAALLVQRAAVVLPLPGSHYYDAGDSGGAHGAGVAVSASVNGLAAVSRLGGVGAASHAADDRSSPGPSTSPSVAARRAAEAQRAKTSWLATPKVVAEPRARGTGSSRTHDRRDTSPAKTGRLDKECTFHPKLTSVSGASPRCLARDCRVARRRAVCVALCCCKAGDVPSVDAVGGGVWHRRATPCITTCSASAL